MPKNKHPKRKLALKMLSHQERLDNVPVFFGKAWEFRKEDIKKRLKK